PPADRYTVEALDDAGLSLVTHTEGVYDWTPRSEVRLGPQEPPRLTPPEERSEGEWLCRGDLQEREGKLLPARETYVQARRFFPDSFGLDKAAGRLAVQLKRYDEAALLLTQAEGRVSNDPEVEYHLGCARLALGDERRARIHWERAVHDRRTRAPALLKLGALLSREGDLESALAHVRAATESEPAAVRAGSFEVVLLRRMGRRDTAGERLSAWRRRDPTSSTLRNEGVKLGREDTGLWRHLAGDPQRVLESVLDYMELGAWDDAVELLAREYPTGEGVFGEPGMPAPQAHPEVAYYRGYCREKLGLSGRADFETASRLDTRYVFPMRAASLPVFRRALEVNPEDATARFLLGSLYLSGGMSDEAAAEWQAARRLDPRIPVLHRNLGLTLLHRGETEPAREVLSEGTRMDPGNLEVYLGLDQALGLLGRPVEERLHALEAYPGALPGVLVFKRALALVEAGRFAEAEGLFPGRFFAREEFGTNVRQVWVEVEIQRILALARGGKCAEA
ncbi:MAG TPA: tetratricopeptide repeat protein, partial [Vicinamibacteria bacterium]